MNPKFWGMLSLAMRAGKLTMGEDKVLKSIQSGKVKLLLLSNDAGTNTEKRFLDKSNYYQIPLLRPADRTHIGSAIGKKNAVVLAVTDEGFAKQLQVLAENNPNPGE